MDSSDEEDVFGDLSAGEFEQPTLSTRERHEQYDISTPVHLRIVTPRWFLDPTDPGPSEEPQARWRARAEYYYAKKDYQAALAACDGVLESPSHMLSTQFWDIKIRSLMKLSRWQEAILLIQDPRYARTVSLGGVYKRMLITAYTGLGDTEAVDRVQASMDTDAAQDEDDDQAMNPLLL